MDDGGRREQLELRERERERKCVPPGGTCVADTTNQSCSSVASLTAESGWKKETRLVDLLHDPRGIGLDVGNMRWANPKHRHA